MDTFMDTPGRRRPTLEEILDQLRRLPEDERRWLVANLQADQAKLRRPSEDRRRATMKRWLARAGSGHTDAADISTRKNRYLPETYATKP